MEKNSKKDRFVFDTSALISLATIGLIDKISGIVEIITTPSVIAELEEFARFDDKYGKASRTVLKYAENFTIAKGYIKETIRFVGKTDNELYNAAKQESLAIITDDIKFRAMLKAKQKPDSVLIFLLL